MQRRTRYMQQFGAREREKEGVLGTQRSMVARTGGRRRRGERERWLAAFCRGDECSGGHQLLELPGQGESALSEPPPSATLHCKIVHQLGEACHLLLGEVRPQKSRKGTSTLSITGSSAR